MITLGQVRSAGRDALTAAHFPRDLLQTVDSALARPGRLFSTTPVTSRLFLAWGAALLPAVPPAWLPAAAACEYVLAACDLIDRHTDGLFARRHRQQPVAGEQTWALPAGISLFLLAQELMSGVEVPGERRVLASRALGRMSRWALAAHQQDSILRTHPEVCLEAALAILRRRSGELVALPCVCAALLAGASPRVVALARRFGRALGCASQLEDDLADRRDDAVTGRKTLPLLLARMERGDTRLAEAATAVLMHRFLEEAAEVLRDLPTFVHPDPYESEALWDMLPDELRSCSPRSPAPSPASS